MTAKKPKSKEPETPESFDEDRSLTGLTEEAKKPWHTRVVFFGIIILMVIGTAILLDAAMAALFNWYTLVIAGLDYNTSITITTTLRLVGIIILILSLWVGYLGFPLYERKPGRILNRILLIGIGIIILFGLSIGLALIYFFVLFLWKPRFILHWPRRRQDLYRFIIVTVILLIMAIEGVLGSGMLGVVLIRPILLAPLGILLAPFFLSAIALIGLIVVFPPYVMLPRFWKSLYNARARIEGFWIEYSRDWMGIVGLIIISFFVVMALFADFLAFYPWWYRILDISTYLLPPLPGHPLGTNQYGQDIYSRLIYGARISLLVGFAASIIAVGIGTMVGLIAGYFGGTIDIALMRITDVFLSLPTLPLMLIFLMLLGQGLQNIILVIAILGWAGTARMVRSETLSLRERPLTEAAHAIGATDIWIILRHIMPNVLPLILANVILGVVNAILSEAGLTFLGFGDIFGPPSWGIILHNASSSGALVNGAWWWLIPPGLCILFTALGFAFVSHSADKVVNPRLRRRR
jgi:peptide/nickel transport system permease protein